MRVCGVSCLELTGKASRRGSHKQEGFQPRAEQAPRSCVEPGQAWCVWGGEAGLRAEGRRRIGFSEAPGVRGEGTAEHEGGSRVVPGGDAGGSRKWRWESGEVERRGGVSKARPGLGG